MTKYNYGYKNNTKTNRLTILPRISPGNDSPTITRRVAKKTLDLNPINDVT